MLLREDDHLKPLLDDYPRTKTSRMNENQYFIPGETYAGVIGHQHINILNEGPLVKEDLLRLVICSGVEYKIHLMKIQSSKGFRCLRAFILFSNILDFSLKDQEANSIRLR